MEWLEQARQGVNMVGEVAIYSILVVIAVAGVVIILDDIKKRGF